MKTDGIKKYLLNCFLLMVPLLLWNLVLTPKLPAAFRPEVFQQNIPAFITWGENISRTVLFLLTALMPLTVVSNTQKSGLVLYIVGILLYCASWMALMYVPDSAWSNSVWGFMAPAYTPLLWLSGIGLVADRFYFRLPYRPWVFILLSVLFLAFHNAHTFIVYQRL